MAEKAADDYTIPPTTRYEFKVWYKQNPHYSGSFNNNIGSGLHGVFDSISKANEEAAKCKVWFTEERVNDNMKDGQVQKEGAPGNITTTVHDNVIVWVEEWVNGVKKESKVIKAA